MVFLRVLLQVAVGVVGLFPSLCFAAQQRVDAQNRGPPWGSSDGRVSGLDTAATRTDNASAAAAAAADLSGDSAAAGVSSGENAASGGTAAAAAALQKQRAEQQGRLEEGALDSTKGESLSRRLQLSQGAEGRSVPRQGANAFLPFDEGSMGPARQIAEQEKDSVDEMERPAPPLTDDRMQLTSPFLPPGTPAAAEATYPMARFSSLFSAHPALAELFVRPPFAGRSLENPRQKRVVEVTGGRLSSAALTMCGRREQDEDTLVVDASPPDSPLVIKALFDGHGGQFTSRFCSSHIHSFLRGMKTATPEAIHDAFLAMDAELLQGKQTRQSGSTGVVALIEELKEEREYWVSGREILATPSAIPLNHKLDPEDRVGSFSGPPQRIRLGGRQAPAFMVTIANVGDSRATLFHANGGFSVLSRDHKPTDPEELQRIEKAGGYVTYSPLSVPRVDGILALSRAFGDACFKDNKELGPQEQRVVAVPEVHSFYALPGDILMLACDGAYEPDDMNWVFVSHFMLTLLHELKNDLTEAGVKLLEHAYQSLSGDNISVLLTRFEAQEEERRVRRFQVTPEGQIVPDSPAEDIGVQAEADLEALKGSMKPTAENPITL